MLYVNPLAQRLDMTGQADFNAPARQKYALQELEHMFIFTLLTEMRKSVSAGGLFEESSEMGHFNEMMDDALAAKMAESGQLGIAKALEQQLQINDIQQSLLNSPSLERRGQGGG